MTYEVQYCINGNWENHWMLDDKPHQFNTRAEAQAELDDFFADIAFEIACGDRQSDEGYERSEFHIQKV